MTSGSGRELEEGIVLAEYTDLPDLASRLLGGTVVAASDEFFAAKENLIRPGRPAFDPAAFGSRGKVYDGWETARRRGPGHDHAIVRLGAPGVVHRVAVDTAHFTGNYPPEVSAEGAFAAGYPSPAELAEVAWTSLVPRSPARGDAVNCYPAAEPHLCTHVRLSIYPDGGVARLRVRGRVVPDPAFLTGLVDLAAAENGGEVAGCSDQFYASAANLILPGRARATNEGWENARRRGDGHDYVTFRLAGAGLIRHVEIDTGCFIGNAPGWVRILAADAGAADRGADRGADRAVDRAVDRAIDRAADRAAAGDEAELAPAPPPDGGWWEALPRTRVQPDTRHRFLVRSDRPATHVRLEVFPDGGLGRLRVYGELTAAALAALRERWPVA